MNFIQNLWQRVFPPIQMLPAGMYSYQHPEGAYRLHLRLEPDGRGVLIVNASTVIQLNRTAAEYAYHLVHQTQDEQVIEKISHRYNVKKETVRQDFAALQDQIYTLIDTPDLDPVTILNFARDEPYSGASAAPYRIDCALTYRLPDLDSGHFAPRERVSRELDENEWKQVLSTAWLAGIPHAIFTGGEPTLRPDLPDLIAHAERLGMVTGLITNGQRLAERDLLQKILFAGLDHVMIVLDPREEIAWEAVRDTLAEDIAVTVHLTITTRTEPIFDETLDRLATMGVPAVSISADAGHLAAVQQKRDAVADRQMRLVWDLPVPYSSFNPVSLELARTAEQPEGAGHAWVYVEPDGDVLPGQGRYETVLGNILTDSWDVIWKKANG